MKRMSALGPFVLVVAIAVVAAAMVAQAGAATPRKATITSARAVRGHLTVTWRLPSYLKALNIAVARRPAMGSDGFFEENRVRFDILRPNQWRWVDSRRLRPGRYWVSVQTAERNYRACFACFAWSRAARVIVR